MAYNRQCIYLIVDILANQIQHIMVCPNDASAIRFFSDSINQKGTLINLHPEDFELRHVGELGTGNEINADDNRTVMYGKTLKDLDHDSQDPSVNQARPLPTQPDRPTPRAPR